MNGTPRVPRFAGAHYVEPGRWHVHPWDSVRGPRYYQINDARLRSLEHACLKLNGVPRHTWDTFDWCVV